ncbi:hypothetical protein MTO96_031130 [Rhipicephalus appendiculatus]
MTLDGTVKDSLISTGKKPEEFHLRGRGTDLSSGGRHAQPKTDPFLGTVAIDNSGATAQHWYHFVASLVRVEPKLIHVCCAMKCDDNDSAAGATNLGRWVAGARKTRLSRLKQQKEKYINKIPFLFQNTLCDTKKARQAANTERAEIHEKAALDAASRFS